MTSYRGQIARLVAVAGPTAEFPYVASGDDDGYLWIWPLPRDVARTLFKAGSALHDTALLADGTILGVGGDALLRWWKDGASGALEAHPGGGFAARRAPDLAHVATFGFDGQIILWGSSPETILQTARGERLGTIVGEPSGGTNGNVIELRVIGGMMMRFSGMRTSNHDGTLFQGPGIAPDLVVQPTLDGIIAGRDEILEAALGLARATDPKGGSP